MGELAAFWKSLEDKARPDIERKLRHFGFKLRASSGGSTWSAEPDLEWHREGCEVAGPVSAGSAAVLLEVVEERAAERFRYVKEAICRCGAGDEEDEP